MNYGNAEEAARLYRDALALEDAPAEKALYHQGLSQALAVLRDAAGAKAELELALGIYETLIRESTPQTVQYLERYIRLADHPRAKKVVDEIAAAQAGKGDIQVLVWLANVYLAIDSPEEALGLYSRAEAATADTVQKGRMTLSRAMLFTRLRKNEEAEAILLSLSKEGPPEIVEAAKKNLLQLYAGQGRTDKIQLIEKK
jgi:tetratricopeptide (TPR) repeat protein